MSDFVDLGGTICGCTLCGAHISFLSSTMLLGFYTTIETSINSTDLTGPQCCNGNGTVTILLYMMMSTHSGVSTRKTSENLFHS